MLFGSFEGELSNRLAAAHAVRFDELTRGVSGIRYFADGAALTRYDLLARSASMRFILARPRTFFAVTLLVGNDHIERIATPLAGTLPGLLRIETEREPFERHLLQAAPFALMSSIVAAARTLPHSGFGGRSASRPSS